ncbi:hypothetical protein A3B02_01095 [Candidatus Roizmanbacteria bacterium RIFCSPLOWO2_01_FULL_42_14]|uniref:Fido domain-containing protein n=1 Tax=Candidatus Roizmanbacteria bacterium RIFCSPLOWO2_01_FULL_42_14 TaxID=1802068 RepID=A0A1F7JA20_9BACT|nr:MAG: hypothetical protein A3B02_01095 [Candidatus Roizmanbacteria bacterium RIFCSPLOWO2_01_FULL_42_14]
MHIPPTFSINNHHRELLAELDHLQQRFLNISLPISLQRTIHHRTLMKSSLFSARIEGNPLSFTQLDEMSLKEKEHFEVFNILDAYALIQQRRQGQPITIDDIKNIHACVMHNLTESPGHFRQEIGAIFNQAGIAVYLSPPPGKIATYLQQLLQYSNTAHRIHPLVMAALVHLIFEKIHPFVDGNGRVGRLLMHLVLAYHSYDFGIPIPFEESIDARRENYYYHLDVGMKHTEEYVLFMIETFLTSARVLESTLQAALPEQIELPPRQAEMYFIIKEHRIVSFDFLHRRFFGVPERTLRYDLKKLHDAGFIKKIGKTKGSFYTIT